MRLRQITDRDERLYRRDRWRLDFRFDRQQFRLGKLRSSRLAGLPGVTVSRSGAELLTQGADGRWYAAPANELPAIGGTGCDVPEGTTNKHTNYNAAPNGALANLTKVGDAAATLTEVDDTAALVAAGFGPLIESGRMNGKVFRLNNTAGVVAAEVRVGGASGNTNSHTISVFARGSGFLNLRTAGVGGQPSIALSGSYVRRTNTLTPSSASDVASIQANAGSDLYFILNQFEEKSFVSNPVAVAGASATRGASSLVVANIARLLTPPFTVFAELEMSALDGVSRYLADISDGTTTSRLSLIRADGNQGEVVMAAGGPATDIALVAGKSGARRLRLAGRVRADESRAAVDGALQAPVTISPLAFDRVSLGHRVNTVSHANSPLVRFSVLGDVSDAALAALTA